MTDANEAARNDQDAYARSQEKDDIIAALRAENEKLRAALKMARPFIGWAGYYPTILAEVDAALEGPQDRMAKPMEEK